MRLLSITTILPYSRSFVPRFREARRSILQTLIWSGARRSRADRENKLYKSVSVYQKAGDFFGRINRDDRERGFLNLLDSAHDW